MLTLDAIWSYAHPLVENASLVWELPGEEREIEYSAPLVKIENNFRKELQDICLL
jgi:hypothetical protein